MNTTSACHPPTAGITSGHNVGFSLKIDAGGAALDMHTDDVGLQG